jgi:tRNA A37 methylthiotransferase MiaB
MKKKYIYINNDVTKDRPCYMFIFEQRKLHGFFEYSDKYEIIDDPDKADYIIVISCVVVQKFKKLTISLINDYSKDNKKTVICYWCFSHLKDEVTKFDTIQNVHFVDNDNTNKFNEIFVEKEFPMFEDVVESANVILKDSADEKNSWITIGHGCVWDCVFCNHKITKKHKSKPVNLIKFELKKRLSQWITHFRFTGDEVGSYGYDFKEKTNFIALLAELIKVDDTFTFSIGPMYPWILIKYEKEILELIESGRATELFIAIEHISPMILKKMNRHYDIEKVLSIIKNIKTLYPRVKASTHIMYWFDGETREEFKKIFRVGDYFDQVQFNELSFTEYLQKRIPDYNHEPKEIQFRKQAILRYYKEKEWFLAFFDHRIIVLKTWFAASPQELNALTF